MSPRGNFDCDSTLKLVEQAALQVTSKRIRLSWHPCYPEFVLTADASRVQHSLCVDCVAHNTAFAEVLTRPGCDFKQDPCLVRGFDYYARTVYDFTASGLGA